MGMVGGILGAVIFISRVNELVMPYPVLASSTQSEHRFKMPACMPGPGDIVVSKIDKAPALTSKLIKQ